MFSFIHRPSIPKYNPSKSDKISPDESAHLSVYRANRAHIDNTAAVSCPENPPPVFASNHDLHEVLVISCNSCSYHIAKKARSESSKTCLFRKLQNIIRRALQHFTKFFQCINRNAFVVLQIKNRSGIDAVFCNQRICCDLFLFHRPPQRAIINQTGTSSHDICFIIVGKEILEYTEKCKYNVGIK